MNNEIDIENSRKVILKACKKMINGEMDFLSGCLEIHKNVFNICEKDKYPDDIFGIFILISSESDHIPLTTESRELYNKEYLKELDKEAEELIDFYKKNILKGCQDVIKYLESASHQNSIR